MIRNKRFRRAASVLTGVLAGIMLLSSTAMAAWSATGHTVNILSMAPSYKTVIDEKYKVPDHVDPGVDITKIVNVKNTGDVDAFVRVKIDKGFGSYDENGKFIKDESLNEDFIQIHYNTDCWEYKESDGYWYYKDILKAKSTTKKPLLDSYRVSTEASNEYAGKNAEIIVTMETVQAEGNALSLWNVTKEELGITAEVSIPDKDTLVTFAGKDKGFQFETKNADLFANFKYLVPGCTRTQKIIIDNASDEGVKISLKAVATKQNSMSDMEKTLVNKLLNKYAMIDVMQGNKLLYSGPVSGNVSGGNANSTMRNYISLGKFEAGQSKELVVSLSLDKAMDNQALALIGKVEWVFYAQEVKENIEDIKELKDEEEEDWEEWEEEEWTEQKTSVSSTAAQPSAQTSAAAPAASAKYPATSPKTGDNSPIMILTCVFAAGVVLLGYSRKLWKQSR